MLTSSVVVLIIPKFIGVHEYGLWQLFIFYSGYVGILHLGWADGLFLRRGGQSDTDVDVASISAETVMFIIFNLLIGLLIVSFGVLVANAYLYIVIALGITVIVANTRTWITMILQSFGNFRGYAINLSVQSLVYLMLIIGILVSEKKDYRMMIAAFVISQLFTCVSGFIQLKKELPNFISKKIKLDFKVACTEAFKNIDAGFKLMIANSTALLIIGVIRFGIQQEWSVSIFGKVSLVLSITNLAMVFINAVSLVLFPTIRRSNQLSTEVYRGIREVLMPSLYILMMVYFPIVMIIPIWLPKYADTLQYVSILMPMMVYQGKFEILSNTFMKNFRMEAILMVINIITLCASVVLTIVSTLWLHDLLITIFSIILVMGFRSLLAEIILSRKLKLNFVKSTIFENVFVFSFVFYTWRFSMLLSFFVYILIMSGYLLVKRRDIQENLVIVEKLADF